MAKIQQDNLAKAIQMVQSISKTEGQKLLDELALEQPELYLAVLYVKQVTQNPLYLIFVLDLLMIIQVALKLKGIKLTTITEEDRRQAYNRYVKYAENASKQSSIGQQKAMERYLDKHQEKHLLLFSMRTMADIGMLDNNDVDTQELVLTVNIVLNCVAAAKTTPIVATTQRKFH